MAQVKQLQELRTTLSLDNDQFNRSAKETQSDLKALKSEMNFVKSSGNDYKNSMEGLRKQQDILNRTLKVQTTQLDQVKKKYDEAVKSSGENSKEARRLQAQYNNLASQVQKTERQLEMVNSTIDEQSNKWNQLSKRLNTAGDNISNFGDRMKGVGQTLSASVTAPVVALGVAAVETTREFREDLARLEVNAKQAGLGMDVMHDSMKSLNAISSETDSNVEALSNLLATGMNANQLRTAVDALSGAVIKFPDTLKIEGVADGLQETLATGKAIGPFAELLERMGVDLEKFDEGLAKSRKSGNDLNYVLNQLSKLNLSQVNQEFRETNRELVEAREAQYGFQESFAQLGRKLEPIMTKATVMVTKVVDAFNELDEETQDNIIKMVGFAAVLGPATIGLGGLANGIGGLLKVGGNLAGLLGRTGGTGLLGRLAGLGLGGPVGLAVGGITALGAGMVATVKYFEDTNEATFETVRAMNEEVKATDELIASFEKLRNQNMLTTDEMLEYMDIMDQLSSTSSPNKVKELKDRQNELLEKSTLTNEQMNEFLKLNDDIIKQAPNAAEAISEQGNAYADNLNALKELNATKREEMMMTAERELMEGLRQEAELLLRQTELEQEVVDLRNLRIEAQEKYTSALNKEIEIENQIAEIEAEMLDLEEQGYKISDEKMMLLADEIGNLKLKREEISKETEEYKEQLDDQEKKLGKKDEELEKINEELKRLDDLKYEYEALWLAHLDINGEKGKGIQAIDEEIARLRENKRAMEENTDEAIKNTEEYRNAKKEIDNQISRLETAKGELEQINKLASETAYEKTINIRTYPSIAKINQEIADTVYKRVNVGIDARYAQRLAYADGTDYHPGGQFLAGEEGFEIGKLGNRMELLSFGTYDRPAGYQVFTHDESKRIIKALNSMPAYANGVSPNGEANRIVQSINNPAPGKYAAYITVVNRVDSREISRETYKTDLEFAGLDEKVRDLFAP